MEVVLEALLRTAVVALELVMTPPANAKVLLLSKAPSPPDDEGMTGQPCGPSCDSG